MTLDNIRQFGQPLTTLDHFDYVGHFVPTYGAKFDEWRKYKSVEARHYVARA